VQGCQIPKPFKFGKKKLGADGSVPGPVRTSNEMATRGRGRLLNRLARRPHRLPTPASNLTIWLGSSRLQRTREPASSSIVVAAAATLNHSTIPPPRVLLQALNTGYLIRPSLPPLSPPQPWPDVFGTDAIALICLAGLQIRHHRRRYHLRLALTAPVISLSLSLHLYSLYLLRASAYSLRSTRIQFGKVRTYSASENLIQ
jgi:hypothetical protein